MEIIVDCGNGGPIDGTVTVQTDGLLTVQDGNCNFASIINSPPSYENIVAYAAFIQTQGGKEGKLFLVPSPVGRSRTVVWKGPRNVFGASCYRVTDAEIDNDEAVALLQAKFVRPVLLERGFILPLLTLACGEIPIEVSGC